MSRLGELAQVISGQHVMARDVNTVGGGIPYLTGPSDFMGDTPRATSWTTHGIAFAERDDILVTVKGSGCGTMAIADQRYAISRQLMAVRPVSCNSRFLWAALSKEVARLNSQSTGTIPGLSRAQILNTSVPALDKRAQERVGQMDALCSRLLALFTTRIAYAQEVKRGLMRELLTGRRRFAAYTELDIKVAPLGELVDSRAGKTPDRRVPEYWSGVNSWVTAKDLKTLRLSHSIDRISDLALESGAPLAQPSDVLVLVRGMTLFKRVPIGLVEQAMSYNQDIRCLRPRDGLRGDYLAHFLSFAQDQLQAMVTQAGHGTGRLDTDRLLSLLIPFPSLKEQQRVAEVLDATERQIALLVGLHAAYETQGRALMHRLLSGDIPALDPAA